MLIYKMKHDSIESRLLGILSGLAGILDGLVITASLGCYASRLEMAVLSLRVRRQIAAAKRARLAEQTNTLRG